MTVKLYGQIFNSADIVLVVREEERISVSFRNNVTTLIIPPKKSKEESAITYRERLNIQLNDIMETINNAMETDDRIYCRIGSR